jgi:hypothetical protein
LKRARICALAGLVLRPYRVRKPQSAAQQDCARTVLSHCYLGTVSSMNKTNKSKRLARRGN